MNRPFRHRELVPRSRISSWGGGIESRAASRSGGGPRLRRAFASLRDNLRIGLIILLMSTATTGCASAGPVSLRSKAAPRGEAYRRTFVRWARQRKVYDQVVLSFSVVAVYRSAELRDAQHRLFLETFRPGRAEAAKGWNGERKRAPAGHEFVVALFTADSRWNVLARRETAKALWHLALVSSNGRRAGVTGIRQLDAASPTVRLMYPLVGDFHRIYAVSFARDPKGDVLGAGCRWFALEVSSSLGKADLRWRVR